MAGDCANAESHQHHRPASNNNAAASGGADGGCGGRFYSWQRFRLCLTGLARRRIRNESLFVMSLVQALCATAALILSTVAATRSSEAATDACVYARLISSFIIMAAACHGLVTSRRKQFGTVLALFVLCQAACLASIALLTCSGVALHAYIIKAQRNLATGSSSLTTVEQAPDLSDLVTSGLAMLLSLLELGVALSCCLACGRQLRPRDSRIVLDPHGNGLIVDSYHSGHDLVAAITNSSRYPLPPPPPPFVAMATPPPAYSTVDRRRWRRRQRPLSADPECPTTVQLQRQADDFETARSTANAASAAADVAACSTTTLASGDAVQLTVQQRNAAANSATVMGDRV